MGSQAMRGAFGGDRGAIAAANLARQQGLAAQQAQGGLLSQGYGQALQAAQQQQGVGLGAEQANRAAYQQLAPQLLQIGQQAFQQPMAAAQAQQGLGQGLLGYGQNVAQGLSGIGQQGAQTGLAAGQALLGAGTLEQQTQQQLNAALYNQYQQQQGYPFQIAQFLANIAYGGGPLYGSTTSGVTGQPTPFFSDERVKEDITEIGRTHDGQKIIKFKYKGSNQPQIGLSAQDVEKHHPETVSETPEGIKAVDYDAATKDAERPHAYAGGLIPSSEGGAVHPSMAGLGFAFGGTPGVDNYSRQLLEQIANPMGGTTPHDSFGKTPYARGSWSPRLAVKPPAPLGSGVQLQRPAPVQTGLSQALREVQGGLGAVESGEKLYKAGEKAYDWARKTVGDVRDKLELPGLTKQAENYAADPNVNPTAARGGRIGYEGGGEVDETPAIPGGGDDTVLGQLTKKQITPAKLPTHTLGGGGGGGGGGNGAMGDIKAGLGAANSAVNIASSLSKMFAAHGGRIGYDEGGEVAAAVATPPDLPIHKLDMSDSAGGGKKDTTAKDALGLAGTFANLIPGVGPVVGAGLKAASMFAKDGGRIDIEHAKRRIAGIESGGRYDAMGPLVRGDRAHGKYQVMGANIPSWTEEALGRRMTPAEFLASPEAQERVFEHHFGKYLNQHGNLADAASMWHSGRPLAEARRAGARDVNMSTEDYVAKIMGGAPPAEAHMRPKEPPVRSAGLAPAVTDVEDTHKGLVPVDTGDDFEMFNDFEMPDRFNRFASGGLVSRRGYQDGGEPTLPPFEPPGAETDRYMPLDNAENSLRRGVREAPYAQPTGVGGLNLPQHQPAALDEHAREGLAAERLNRTWRGEYDTPGAMPSVNPPTPSAAAPPIPPSRNVATVGGNSPPVAAPVAPEIRSAVPQDQNATGVVLPLKSAGAPPEDRDFFTRAGDWVGRNQNWLLPLAGGIGKMLASPSPYLGVAIGQGLAEGAQTGLGASFKQQGLDINKQQADLASARQFYDVYKDTLGRLNASDFAGNSAAKQALQVQANNLSGYITKLLGKYVGLPKDAQDILNDVSGGAAPATSASAPESTQAGAAAPGATQAGTAAPGATQAGAAAPGATTATSAPEPPKAPPIPVTQRAQAVAPRMFDNLPDERNPLKIIEKANRVSGTVPLEQVVALYNQASQIEQNWAQSGRYQDRDGVDRLVPGWLENKMQELRGTGNIKYFSEAEGTARARSNAMGTLDDMQKALENYQSGHFDAYLAQANGVLSGLGLPPLSDKKDLADYQRFLKDSYAMIFNQMGAMGGQPMKIAMEGLSNTVPSALLQPKANKQLLTNIKATLSREDKLFADQVNAALTSPAAFDPAAFYATWSKAPENNLETFKERVGREMAVRGVQPESMDDIGKKFIVEPSKTNGLSRPTPMYLLRFEPTPDGRAYIPVYGASR